MTPITILENSLRATFTPEIVCSGPSLAQWNYIIVDDNNHVEIQWIEILIQQFLPVKPRGVNRKIESFGKKW